MTRAKTIASAAALASLAVGGVASASAAPAPAPAGGTLLITINGNLHTINGDGGGLRRLTTGGSISDASYSPDGRRIAYSKNVRGTPTIFVMPATGGAATKLYAGSNPSWSPDGSKLAFGRTINHNEHIYTAPARPGATAKRILTGNVDGDGSGCYYLGYRDPDWSPTGASIAVTRVCDDDHFQYDTVLARPSGGLVAGKKWGGHQAEFNRTGTTLAAATWDWAFDAQLIFTVKTTSRDETYLNDYVDGFSYGNPVWSPDDGRIAATHEDVSGPDDDLVVFSSRDGSGMRTLLEGSNTRRIIPRDWKA